MDFDKIKTDALMSAIHESVDKILKKEKPNDTFPKYEDEQLQSQVELVKLLQKFAAQVSVESIKIYHQELCKKLAKQGIKI